MLVFNDTEGSTDQIKFFGHGNLFKALCFLHTVKCFVKITGSPSRREKDLRLAPLLQVYELQVYDCSLSLKFIDIKFYYSIIKSNI